MEKDKINKGLDSVETARDEGVNSTDLLCKKPEKLSSNDIYVCLGISYKNKDYSGYFLIKEKEIVMPLSNKDFKDFDEKSNKKNEEFLDFLESIESKVMTSVRVTLVGILEKR